MPCRAPSGSYEADVTNESAWTQLSSRAETELGAITGGVLVAGAWGGGVPLHEEKDDTTWHATMSANLETAHRSLRALLPGRVSRGAGSIVVIGSRNVERPWTGASAAAYTASKAAVVALAQAVAAEVLASGVRVNAVLPSTLDTEANRRAMSSVDPKTPATPVVRAAPGSPAAVLAGDDLDAFDTMATAAAAQQAELGAKKQSCIAKGLALDRAMHGHVELAVSLEADGTVRASEVTSNRDLPPIVVACIRRAVTETHYLPPTNAAAFTRRESAGIP